MSASEAWEPWEAGMGKWESKLLNQFRNLDPFPIRRPLLISERANMERELRPAYHPSHVFELIAMGIDAINLSFSLFQAAVSLFFKKLRPIHPSIVRFRRTGPHIKKLAGRRPIALPYITKKPRYSQVFRCPLWPVFPRYPIASSTIH
jgi:hypothetical protein